MLSDPVAAKFTPAAMGQALVDALVLVGLRQLLPARRSEAVFALVAWALTVRVFAEDFSKAPKCRGRRQSSHR